MYYVYLLLDKNKKIYVGSTNDLRRRVKEHFSGKTNSTKGMNKPELYYYEAYVDESSARIREKKLKQFGSSYQGLIKRIGLK